VGVICGSSGVVEGSGAWAAGNGGEGPQLAGGGQAPVAGVARQHDLGFAGCFRDGGCAGVLLAGFSIGIAVRAIPELTEHPGAQDRPESWQGADDLGVRVLIKSLRQSLLESGDLGIQLGDDRQGGH
jgi:hypothetical protein